MADCWVQLEKMRRNYEIEISGLDIAIQAQADKIKKRDEQYNSAEAQVRKQKDETRKILREFNPKLIQSFHSAAMKGLKQSKPSMIYQCAQVLVGLLKELPEVDQKTVSVSLMSLISVGSTF